MTSIMLGDLVYVMITILGASVRDAGRDRQGGAAPLSLTWPAKFSYLDH